MRFSFVDLMYDVGGHRYRELLPWHPEELEHMIVTVGSTQPSLPFDVLQWLIPYQHIRMGLVAYLHWIFCINPSHTVDYSSFISVFFSQLRSLKLINCIPFNHYILLDFVFHHFPFSPSSSLVYLHRWQLLSHMFMQCRNSCSIQVLLRAPLNVNLFFSV